MMKSPHEPGHIYNGITLVGGAHVLGNVYHLPGRPETPPTPSSTILPRHDPNFVEREGLLQRLRAQALKSAAWVALVGLGGIGKTQLALRYAQQLREQRPNVWILWIFASNAARFEESTRDIAEQLRLPGRQEPKANVLQLLQNWLAVSRRTWVVVLDNTDDAEYLLEPPSTSDNVYITKRRIDYLPECSHGTVILTTRNKNEALKLVHECHEDNIIEVPPMDVEHAQALLKKKLGPSYMYMEKDAAQLAQALDYVPLALSQAASYIRQKRRYTIENYLKDLEKSRQSRTSLLRQHGTVPKQDRESSSSIILAWQISFEYIHNARKSAADLLALMSFCDRQAIPEFLLHDVEENEIASCNGTPSDNELESTFDEDIRMLEDFSFVSPTINAITWDMHRLVQDATQWWLIHHGRMDAVQQSFIERLHIVVPTGEYENWQTCKMLMPHVRCVAELKLCENELSLLQATVMYRIAWYEMRGGSLANAEKSAESALFIRERLSDQDDADVLCAKTMLGEVYRGLGRWAEAEELEVNVLETRRRVLGLGPEHPSTLSSMANLASTYWHQGRWAEAEELEVEVMETRRRVLGLGPEHPDMLVSMANLASTFCNQGRWDEAEELKLKVMDISTRVFGPEHPDALSTMANLAVTYSRFERWAEAEELELKVLETRRRVFGPEHPSTLTSMGNLASTYTGQGRWAKGEELKVKVMHIRTRVLGAEHPDTLTSVANLASTYWDRGRWADAEELELKVLETRKRVFGAEHPDTLSSMNNLAVTLFSQARLQEAYELMKQCFDLRSISLGPTSFHAFVSASWLQKIEEKLGTAPDHEMAIAGLRIHESSVE